MNLAARTPRGVVLVGDARQRLAELPAESVDCVITSPPYFNLRDYGTPGQIGLEAHIVEWVEALRLVLAEVARVLKPGGSLWLNVGDSFSRHDRYGAPPKSLLLGPERIAQALVSDGWLLRSKVVWAKANPLPSSVRDRLSSTHEFVYFFTRRPDYFFDLDVIREPLRSRRPPTSGSRVPAAALGKLTGGKAGFAAMARDGVIGHPLGKNPGDVWSIPVSNFRGSHFATFPPGLVIRPLLATCPERVCSACGVPWSRQIRRDQLGALRPGCGCNGSWRPGLVLDPFFGVGTVGVVAEQYRRDWLGIELNPTFARQAYDRISAARQQAGAS